MRTPRHGDRVYWMGHWNDDNPAQWRRVWKVYKEQGGAFYVRFGSGTRRWVTWNDTEGCWVAHK